MKQDTIQDLMQQHTPDTLFEKVSAVIDHARQMIATTINTGEVYAKYEIGRYIVEDEQQGQYRAQYGKQVLKNLSTRLTEKYGEGWSLETLKKCRFFYSAYSTREIGATPLTQFADEEKVHTVDLI